MHSFYGILKPLAKKKNIRALWEKYIFQIIIPENFQNLSLKSGKNTLCKPPEQI